jgi:ferritin
MLSEKMGSALNEQVNAELYSSYLYWSMAAHLDSLDYPGMAHYMEVQAKEELMHAVKLYRYIIDQGGKASMKTIDMPPASWDSVLEVMENVLEHEKKVTSLINNLVDIAIEQKDHATNNFLQWFVAEQVEEESNASGVLVKAKRSSGSMQALMMLDSELGQRVAPYNILPVAP